MSSSEKSVLLTSAITAVASVTWACPELLKSLWSPAGSLEAPSKDWDGKYECLNWGGLGENEVEQEKGKTNLSHNLTPQWDAEGPTHASW